jgi:arylsulfatase A-like enzyme
MKHRTKLIGFLAACLSIFWLAGSAMAAEKPNILVIWGDDVGYWNVSHNNRGMMGYIIMLSKAALPGVQPLSPARSRCAPA